MVKQPPQMPIKRVPLIVSGGDNEVVIEVMDIDDDELGEMQDICQGLSQRDDQEHMQNSLILQLRRELAEAHANAERQITVA
jgi:small ligand-binding sensory domain FIST